MLIDVDGVKINYEIYGDGKSVLLLHGWGCNIASMTAIFNSLKQSHKVYVLDFPGESGASDLPPVPWGVPEYSKCIKKFMELLKIEKPDVIGHSFGGRIIIYLASTYPELFDKIILTDAAGIKKRISFKKRMKIASYKIIKQVLKFLMPKEKFEKWITEYRDKHGSADYKALKNEVMRASFNKIISLDLTNNLSKIKSPTLLIWGELDNETPLYMAHIMEKNIPDSGLVVIKDGGHFSYVDNILEYNLVVKNFLG